MNTTTPNNHFDSDREALSALFDGELVGDVARFALKRLDHDQNWRSTCDRWQRIGDALRGQSAALPLSFPERVRDALRDEAAVAAVPARRAAGGGIRWGSVGMAASAALVAFVLARMPIGLDAAHKASPAQVAAQSLQQAPAQSPSTPDPGLQQASAAVAIAAVARPLSERVAQRSRNVERARAATDRVVSAAVGAHSGASKSNAPFTGEAPQPVTAINTALVADVPEVHASQALQPGTLQTSLLQGEALQAEPARPWPRAVLPRLNGGGTLSADFAGPSFYPFSPGPTLQPANDDTAPASPPEP
ncbi:sigma-E factor negative regulatory protein [Lysobacter sp. 2RAF19]